MPKKTPRRKKQFRFQTRTPRTDEETIVRPRTKLGSYEH
ncbi:unnamed protein product [Rhodiola kirilowii]